MLQLGLASLASCPPARGFPPHPTLQAHCRVAYSAHDSKPIAARCPQRLRGLIQRALSQQARWKGEMVELSWEPRATVFKNFLTPEECDTLIALACPFTQLLFLSCSKNSNCGLGSCMQQFRAQLSHISTSYYSCQRSC